MKMFLTIMAVCLSVPALSAIAATDPPTVPPQTTEQAPVEFHAFNGFSSAERYNVTPLSDRELAAIEGQGTIVISILVFSGSVVSVDHLMSNFGPPNVGVIRVVPPSPCRDVC